MARVGSQLCVAHRRSVQVWRLDVGAICILDDSRSLRHTRWMAVVGGSPTSSPWYVCSNPPLLSVSLPPCSHFYCQVLSLASTITDSLQRSRHATCLSSLLRSCALCTFSRSLSKKQLLSCRRVQTEQRTGLFRGTLKHLGKVSRVHSQTFLGKCASCYPIFGHTSL